MISLIEIMQKLILSNLYQKKKKQQINNLTIIGCIWFVLIVSVIKINDV